jgi:predicted transcriptional regulator
MTRPLKTVSFKLSEELDEALTDLARLRKSSRSALVREALAAFEIGRERSVTAAAGRLVGSLEGPADLSSNPRHMRGYGK